MRSTIRFIALFVIEACLNRTLGELRSGLVVVGIYALIECGPVIDKILAEPKGKVMPEELKPCGFCGAPQKGTQE